MLLLISWQCSSYDLSIFDLFSFKLDDINLLIPEFVDTSLNSTVKLCDLRCPFIVFFISKLSICFCYYKSCLLVDLFYLIRHSWSLSYRVLFINSWFKVFVKEVSPISVFSQKQLWLPAFFPVGKPSFFFFFASVTMCTVKSCMLLW